MRGIWKRLLVVAVCSVAVGHGQWRACAAEPPVVLDRKTYGGMTDHLLRRHLFRRVTTASQKIAAETDACHDTDAVFARGAKLRASFIEALGGWPEKIPLNARVTGTFSKKGYRAEKVLFESRPGFYVTAVVFIPDDAACKPPYPGVLVSCGHSIGGKSSRGYLPACTLAAANGFVAMIYDPVDQGERMQMIDENGKYTLSIMSGHNNIGVNAIPLGWNTASFMIWDGIRALDYLAARPDVDPERIGCIGNSGGGTMTAYLGALDERARAIAPSCYITSWPTMLSAIGVPDAEQCIFGQFAFGMEQGEFLLMCAPRPAIVCAATQDFFPIDGTRETFERIRKVFERIGLGDRIALAEAVGPHQWHKPLQEAGVRWMCRWVKGTDDFRVPSPALPLPSSAEVRVTEKGQVMLLPGARSVYDLMRAEKTRLAAVRAAAGDSDLVGKVRLRAGIRPLAELPGVVAKPKGEIRTAAGVAQKIALEVEGGIPLPGLLFVPEKSGGQSIVYVHGGGKSAALTHAGELAQAGNTVFAVDLRAFGELQGCKRPLHGSDALDEQDAQVSYLFGQSLVGMRAEDILVCAQWLAGKTGQKKVGLHAVSWAVTPALHAVVAEHALFHSLTLDERVPDWGASIDNGLRNRFSDVVHGALRDYDLPELERFAAAQLK